MKNSRPLSAVTPFGWFVVALAAAGLVLGLTLSWVEAWVVAAACAVLLLLAIPFLIGSRSYTLDLGLDRSSVVAGGEVRAILRVENRGARPALPALAELPVGDALREIRIPFIPGKGAVDLDIAIPARTRGVIRVGPLTIARRDPLALLHREVTWPGHRTLHVHPKTAALPANSAGLVRDLEGAASPRLTDSDLAFHAVREYAPGDEPRHVHWKSTAKTGTLMVRQFEESQTARVAVLFDAQPGEYRNDDEFELAVSAAASFSVQAVREGRERYIASASRARGRAGAARAGRSGGADGLEELPSRDPQELLNAWSELEAAPDGVRFEHLATGLAHSRRPLSVVVVVTGSEPDPERIRRSAVSFAPDVRVIAVRCELHAEPRAWRSDRLTVYTIGALGDLPQLMLRSAA